jgi:hypothetical protein
MVAARVLAEQMQKRLAIGYQIEWRLGLVDHALDVAKV